MFQIFQKTVQSSLVFVICFLFSGAASAAAPLERNARCHPILWNQVKILARHCVVEMKSDQRCDAIQFGRKGASFRLHGQNYRVRIIDSVYSDGGDLNDLLLDRDDGCQLQRRNVPAFGNILRALAR